MKIKLSITCRESGRIPENRFVWLVFDETLGVLKPEHINTATQITLEAVDAESLEKVFLAVENGPGFKRRKLSVS